MRRRSTPLLVVDAGDMLYPRRRSPFDSADRADARAAFIIRAQGRLGLDVWTPSVLDLRYGLERLVAAADEAGIALLASNLVRSDGRGLPLAASRIEHVGGVRLGLIGLVGRRPGLPAGLRLRDPIAAARRARDALAGRAELVLVLSNLGIEADQRLAERVDGLHLIFGAGDDRMILIPRRVGASLLLQPYKRGEYLGLVALRIGREVLPLVDALERDRIEHELQRIGAGQPERTAELRRRLRAATGPSSFRAVLRPLSADLPSDADMQRAIRSQLRAEAEPD
jgi:2',3'-cyclic-nucleotide 2'-phosphodiesterase (5'-nucleotidase family)